MTDNGIGIGTVVEGVRWATPQRPGANVAGTVTVDRSDCGGSNDPESAE